MGDDKAKLAIKKKLAALRAQRARHHKAQIDEADLAEQAEQKQAKTQSDVAELTKQFASTNYVDHWNAIDTLLQYDAPEAFASLLSRFDDPGDKINAEDATLLWFIARPRTALEELAKGLVDGRREAVMHFLFVAQTNRVNAFGPAPRAAYMELDNWLDVTPVGDEGMVREVMQRRQVSESIARTRKRISDSIISDRASADTLKANLDSLDASIVTFYGEDLETITQMILAQESQLNEAIGTLEDLELRRVALWETPDEQEFVEKIMMKEWEDVLLAAGSAAVYNEYTEARATSLNEPALYQNYKIDEFHKMWDALNEKEPPDAYYLDTGASGLYDPGMEMYAAVGYWRGQLAERITPLFERHKEGESISILELAEIQRDLTIVALYMCAFGQVMVLGSIWAQLDSIEGRVLGDFDTLQNKLRDYAFRFHDAMGKEDVEAIANLANDDEYKEFLDYKIEAEVQDRVDDTMLATFIITVITAIATMGLSYVAEVGFVALGLSEGALGVAVFATDVTVFTLVNAGLRNAAFGEPITFESLTIDLAWNAITFGVFKGIGALVGKLSVGAGELGELLTFGLRQGVALTSFTGVAAVIERLRTGKWPANVREFIGQSVAMYVLMAVAARGMKPFREKLDQTIANKQVAKALDADLAKLDSLTAELDGLLGRLAGNQDPSNPVEPLTAKDLERLKDAQREHAVLIQKVAEALKANGVITAETADAIIKSAKEVFAQLGAVKIGDVPAALLDLASVPGVKQVGTDGTTYSYAAGDVAGLQKALADYLKRGYTFEWDPTAQQLKLLDPDGRLAASLIPDLRSPATNRVQAPIGGLFDAIDLYSQPSEFTITHEGVSVKERDAQGNPTKVEVRIRAEATIIDEDGNPKTVTAKVTRNFDFTQGELTQNLAMFDTGFPEWVKLDPRFDPQRGVPTSVYLMLRALKLAGVPFGGLKTVHLSTVINVRTMVEFEIAKREGKSDGDAILGTHSVSGYTQSFLMQAGLRITGARVTPGFEMSFAEAFKDMSKDYPKQVEIARKLLADKQIPETEKAQIGFDVDLDLEPVQAKLTTSPAPGPAAVAPVAPAPPTTALPPFVPIVRGRDDDTKNSQ